MSEKLTCSVPEAGRLLGIGRDAAYAAAARGEIPTLRMGRRIVVPLAKLQEMLGLPTSVGRGQGDPPHPADTITDAPSGAPAKAAERLLGPDHAGQNAHEQ